jgi:hypothetical protein
MRCFRRIVVALIFACMACAASPIAAAANTDKVAHGSQASVAQTEGDASPVTPDAPSVDPAKLDAWIAQLDDDMFAIRESAQQQLAAAGATALADVGQAAAGGSLESSTRAVNILLSWAQSTDAELSLGALEQLAVLKNRPTESAMAAQRLADVREAAALKAIVDLGGHVDFDRQLAGANGLNPSLQVIIGPQWKGGLEGLRHLQAIRRASTVSFHSSAVGEEALEHLASLTHLKRIEFYQDPDSQVSPEAVNKLKERLPQVAVEIRGAARLGIAGPHMIAGMPNPGGASVTQVLPGSAAAKAGLVQGDVITHIANSEVKDFEHLTKEIAQCRPGQSVALKVIRQSPPGQPPQTLDVTVTFDRWGDDMPAANPVLDLPGGPDPIGMVPRGLPRPINLDNRR